MVKHSANSTISDIGRVYYHTLDQKGFYGNQYVRATRLTNVGSKILKVTPVAGYIIGGAQVFSGVAQDVLDSNTGSTNYYHTVRAAASWGTAIAATEAGMWIGGIIGSAFGGIGAIPGSIIGATVFGAVAGYFGGEVAGMGVDYLYYGR